MKTYLIGIDIGTSGCKIAVFNKGRAVSSLWKRPANRLSDLAALAVGASGQDSRARAEALRKLRRVIFMVESSFN